jgi:predicted RNA methylase
MIRSTTRRLQRHLRGRGLAGTAIFAAKYPFYTWLALRHREVTRREAEQSLAFDRRYGVDTAADIRAENLNVASENWVYGGHYEATPVALFSKMMAHLSIDREQFTFIDYGSGKGRVLLLAALQSFRRVVGIEYSRELHEIAQRNVRALSTTVGHSSRIELVNMDASQYSLPPEPSVLFLYNPFGEVIMRTVLKEIDRSLSESPRPLYIMYVNPMQRRLFQRARFLTKIADTGRYSIYRPSMSSNGSV